MIYILLIIFIYLFIYFLLHIRLDHLSHQKYKIKKLENNFKLINISINDMNKFEKKKKELTKKRTYIKNTWLDWYIG